MPEVSITAQLQPSGSVQLNEDSPLAKAQLKALNFDNHSVAEEFDKPIDLFVLNEVGVGLTIASPQPSPTLVTDTAVFALSGGVNAKFAVFTSKQKNLFADDQFAPAIPISQGECWAGLTVSATLQESVSAQLSASFGVSITNGTTVAMGTLVHFPEPSAPMPTFTKGLCAVLEKYTIPDTAAKIRATPSGVAYTLETSGTVSLGACYKAPLQVNPLATLNLPFNLALCTQAGLKASVTGTLSLEGSFITRVSHSSDGQLVFGLYKKKETTLKAELSASAGIAEDIGKTDILAKVLDVIVPAADLKQLNLNESEEADLKAGLKACVDESISIAVNAICSASVSDEAAVIYELDLTVADLTATDKALTAALRGDWSLLESLPNAHAVRHIIRDLQEHNHRLNLNLLGFYNATSSADYIKSTTVVHDEHGQIALTDKVEAKTLLAGVTPYAAKSDKLRAALAQAFVATVTYGVAAGKLAVTAFTVSQSFLDYRSHATAADLSRHLNLAKSVGFTLAPDWDALVKAGGISNRSEFFLETAYDKRGIMRLFYADPDARTPYTSATLDRIGREAKLALLDPSATNSVQRRLALSNDDIWNEMNSNGDVANFKQIPGLSRLDATALGAISADWIDIRWWSDAMKNLTPQLTSVLTAIDKSTSANPLTNADFMTAQKQLEEAMVKLSHKTQGAFGEGWGLAVMYRLATAASNAPSASVQMDIGWNQKFEHMHSGAVIAVGQIGGD